MNQFREDSRMGDQLMAQVIVEKTAAAYHYFDGLYTYGKEYMEEIEEENRELEREGKEFLADKTKEAVDKITTVNNNNAALEQKILLEQMELIGDAGKAVADTVAYGIEYVKEVQAEQEQLEKEGGKIWSDIVLNADGSVLSEEDREAIHLCLDALGASSAGFIFDAMNAALYNAEGNKAMAEFSMGMVLMPGILQIGSVAGKAGKYAAEGYIDYELKKIMMAPETIKAVQESLEHADEVLEPVIEKDLGDSGKGVFNLLVGGLKGLLKKNGDEAAEAVTDTADDAAKKLADVGTDAAGGLDEIAGASDDVAVNSAETLAEPKNLVDNVGDDKTVSQADRIKINGWDYAPDDELYLEYKDVYDNPKYYNQETGAINWPENDGFDGTSIDEVLQPGTRIDRYGSDYGSFVSPEGTPYEMRAVAPGTDRRPYSVFEILKPIEVKSGSIAPWFGEPGGGKQYLLPNTVDELLDDGMLRRIR